MRTENVQRERRRRSRFGIKRELRYKLLERHRVFASGTGHTIDMGRGGVAFSAEIDLRPGTSVELSISWPALLNQTCPMQLVVFGRVLRSAGHMAVCTLNKYEFRTARVSRTDASTRDDSMLEHQHRWFGGSEQFGTGTRGMSGYTKNSCYG
jgi:hypothetical protein